MNLKRPSHTQEAAKPSLGAEVTAKAKPEGLAAAPSAVDVALPVAPEAQPSVDLLKDGAPAAPQPAWHVARLQAFVDRVASMTTDQEKNHEGSADDALEALDELIVESRKLAEPQPLLVIHSQRAKLIEVMETMLAVEGDLREKDNQLRYRKRWYGCNAGSGIQAGERALDQAKASPDPAPAEAEDQRFNLLEAGQWMLADMDELVRRYNVSLQREGMEPEGEPACLAEARKVILKTPSLETERVELTGALVAMLAVEKDLQIRERQWSLEEGPVEAVPVARRAVWIAKNRQLSGPKGEDLPLCNRLLFAADAMVTHMDQLLRRNNQMRSTKDLPVLGEPTCVTEARALVQRISGGSPIEAPDEADW